MKSEKFKPGDRVLYIGDTKYIKVQGELIATVVDASGYFKKHKGLGLSIVALRFDNYDYGGPEVDSGKFHYFSIDPCPVVALDPFEGEMDFEF